MRISFNIAAILSASVLFAAGPLAERLLSPVADVRNAALSEFNQLPRETQEQFVPTFMVGMSSDDPDVHAECAVLLKKLGAAPKSQAEVPAAPPSETSDARQARNAEKLNEIRQAKADRYKTLKQELDAEKTSLDAALPSVLPDKPRDPIRDALIDGLHDPVPFVRSRSARRLGGLQPPAVEAIPALRDLLKDTDAECRGSAAGALGALGPRASEAIADLEPLTADRDANVRAIAAEALNQIRG